MSAYQTHASSESTTRRPSAVAVTVEPASPRLDPPELDRTPPRTRPALSSIPVWHGGASPEGRKRALLKWMGLAVMLLLGWRLVTGGQESNSTGLPSVSLRGRKKDIVWSSRADPVRQYWLDRPWQNYRFTVLQALVRRREETYDQRFDGRRGMPADEGKFVQILSFLEETPYPKPSHAPWQVLSSHRRVVKSVQCKLSTSYTAMVDTTDGWIAPSHSSDIIPTSVVPSDLEWVTIINCPLPPAFASIPSGTITIDLTLHLHDSSKPFSVPVKVVSSTVPRAAEGSTSICISPMWGHTSASVLLEWRQHHLALGISTVHWYARDGSVQKWVDALNSELGTTDDFFHAPPLSRETFGKAKGALEDAGQYADQAIYYQHCKLRSLSSANPTQWVAFTDLDEHFLPTTSFEPAALAKSISSYLSSRPQTVGSVCISRTNYRVPPEALGHSYRGLHFGEFSSYFPPVGRAIDSTKCVHRIRGVETGWVHRPDVLYQGYTMEEVADDKAPLRILHDNRKGTEGPLQMYKGAAEGEYWRSLLQTRNDAMRKLGVGSGDASKKWACVDVPCAF